MNVNKLCIPMELIFSAWAIITISQLYKDFYPLKPYDSDEDEDFFRDATKDIMNNSDLVVLLYRPAYYGLISPLCSESASR